MKSKKHSQVMRNVEEAHHILYGCIVIGSNPILTTKLESPSGCAIQVGSVRGLININVRKSSVLAVS